MNTAEARAEANIAPTAHRNMTFAIYVLRLVSAIGLAQGIGVFIQPVLTRL